MMQEMQRNPELMRQMMAMQGAAGGGGGGGGGGAGGGVLGGMQGMLAQNPEMLAQMMQVCEHALVHVYNLSRSFIL